VGKKARVREIAAQMADTHLRCTGISKGAGMVQRDQLVAMYAPFAEGVVALADAARVLAERACRQDEITEMIARQVRVLQALNAGPRGVSEIHRGVVDLDLERFHLGLIDKQPPKQMNGHHRGDGVDAVLPPSWHPENE
jgi:hypothetical protein